MIIPMSIYGQKTAQWETKFYFEDAVGNRDSLTVGYDTTANVVYNPDFGEENIREVPWDSVFEVRAGRQESDRNPNLPLSKTLVAKLFTGISDGRCYFSESPVRMFVKIKHLPVTITWDSTHYQGYCNGGSYLAPHEMGSLFLNWWFTDTAVWWPKPPEFACLSTQSSYVLHSFTETTKIWVNYLLDQNTDGSVDTIYAVNFYGWFPEYDEFSPCRKKVSVQDVQAQDVELKVYPNPAQTMVYIESQDRLRWTLKDIQGRQRLAGVDPWLDISDLQEGVYFLTIYIGDRIITKKIIK